MTGSKYRYLGLALIGGAGAGLLTLTSIMNSAFAYGTPVDTNPADPFEVMGGTGLPIPDQDYIDQVQALYLPSTELFPGQPTFPNADPQALVTPEEFYPLTGVNSLPLDTSVSQGVTILNDAIIQQLAMPGVNDVGVFGISQSAVIASLEMEQLDPSGIPSHMPLQFVLVGDLMNPNGGLFERFDGLTLPSLGLNFYGATPANDFPTTIYTLEYDGYADFPRYPIDILSDLNAIAGMSSVHDTYLDLTPAQLATAIPVGTEGATQTTYYMIPTDNLPLLDPLRSVPFIGNPLADLVQPDLTTLVNLGYGDPDYGWSTAPANVPTPFGLFPSLSDFEKVPQLLVNGTQEGISAFLSDIGNPGSSLPTLSSLSDPLSLLTTTMSPSADIGNLATAFNPTDVVNTLTNVVPNDYAVLLPTADIGLALATSLPAYDASLFVDQLEDGNLLDAVGYPIAADMALGALLANFELGVIGDAVSSTLGALIP